MNQREAKRLVWEWIAIQMDEAVISYDETFLLLDKEEDEVEEAEVTRVRGAWDEVRDRVGRLSGDGK